VIGVVLWGLRDLYLIICTVLDMGALGIHWTPPNPLWSSSHAPEPQTLVQKMNLKV